MASKKTKQPTLSVEEYLEIAQYRIDDFLVLLKRAVFKTQNNDVIPEFNVDFQLIDLFDDEEWEEILEVSVKDEEFEKAFSGFLFENFSNVSISQNNPTVYTIQVTDSEE
ncbi:MAG: hypothetical protein NTX05_05980 [Fusobacteria bacterium]|nr:hypothetical protein [Fusobacteriota bacterium]